jgi:hypothetical protein
MKIPVIIQLLYFVGVIWSHFTKNVNGLWTFNK